METAEFEAMVYRIDGYIDALSSITKTFRHHRACAHSAELDTQNIDASITDLLSSYSSSLKDDFPDLDVPTYSLKKAISIKNWIQHLHRELETYLLPEEYKKSVSESETLKSIQYNLAWQVMEMIRIITNAFESEVIYKVSYESSDSRNGVYFVIPANHTCLILCFDSVKQKSAHSSQQ